MVDLTSSSPPGSRPKPIRSRVLQAIQRSSVTRATAAKPIPVIRQTTSRILGTAAISAMRSMSWDRRYEGTGVEVRVLIGSLVRLPCRGSGEDGERQVEASNTDARGVRHRPCAASIASIQAKRVTGCPPVCDGRLRLPPGTATAVARRPGLQWLPSNGGRRPAQGCARSSWAARASRVPSAPKRAAKWLPSGRPLGVHHSGTDMAG